MQKEKGDTPPRSGPTSGEARFREIADLLPCPVMVHDAEGRVELVNREWSRLTGYTRDDLPSLSEWGRRVFGPAAGAQAPEGERPLRSRDGTSLVWDFRSAAMGELPDGRAAFLLTAIDRTASRHAERARHENAEKFTALAEESPLGIVIARRNTVIYCNGTAGAFFGVAPRDSQGMDLDTWLGILPPVPAGVIGPLLRGDSGHADPFRLGDEAWIEGFGKMVGAASGDMVMATFLEVTDRVLTEERERIQRARLIQAEKLASLGELVAGVAHEINNPNHAIALNADFLAGAWASAAPLLDRALEGREGDLVGGMEWREAREEAPRLLSGITAASRDIDAIVRGLKDYARGEARPEPEEVALNLVVKAALTLLSNYVKKATNHLVVGLEEGMPPVRAHFQRLEQVAVNLIQNACQALTDPGQSVRVTTAYDDRTNLVSLVVADEGRGMSAELLGRIKDPFFTTKHDIGGVGLGVSISESIIAEYGGRLEYRSDPGSGTVASVSLRAAVERAAPGGADAVPGSGP